MRLLDWLSGILRPRRVDYPSGEIDPERLRSEEWGRQQRMESAARRANRVLADYEAEIMRRGRGGGQR